MNPVLRSFLISLLIKTSLIIEFKVIQVLFVPRKSLCYTLFVEDLTKICII